MSDQFIPFQACSRLGKRSPDPLKKNPLEKKTNWHGEGKTPPPHQNVKGNPHFSGVARDHERQKTKEKGGRKREQIEEKERTKNGDRHLREGGKGQQGDLDGGVEYALCNESLKTKDKNLIRMEIAQWIVNIKHRGTQQATKELAGWRIIPKWIKTNQGKSKGPKTESGGTT